MESVLDVYERPYDPRFPVVNLDESPKQLISEVRESFVDSQGVKHEDYEYSREGVADMYMIVEALAGRREVHRYILKIIIIVKHMPRSWRI